MIAEIILNSNVKQLNRTFDYKVPENMEEKIKIGSRVMVPFANMKKLEDGFVINLKEISEFKVKEISAIDDVQLLDEKKIQFAKWMSKRYFCNLSDCLKLMLPPGTKSKAVENRVKEKNINFIYLKKDIEEIENDIQEGKVKSEKQIRALRFLMENDGAIISDLEMFADVTRAVVDGILKKGYIEIVEKQVERNPFVNKNIKRTEKLKLTREQQKAFDLVSESIDEKMYEEFLLFGVTGSRKNGSVLTIDRESIK